MIHVEHLGKTYGPIRVLDDVSFDVARGEVVGLLGPNGAGKTTLMRILTGYMPPTEGRASVAGFDVFEHSLEARRRIGYLPESTPLYSEMSVRAYLDYRASLYGHKRTSARAVQRAMSACRIADRADSLIDQLSKGLRQRVGLAQAIVHGPDVLILDEPTIGLDPRQNLEVRQLIRDLGRERTILLSSHILSEIRQVCSRVLILHGGRLAAEGTPDELTARLQGRTEVRVEVRAPPDAPADRQAVIRTVMGEVPGVTGVRSQSEHVHTLTCSPDVDVRPRLTQAILQAGWELLELRAVETSLEEIFLQLTVDKAQETGFLRQPSGLHKNPVSEASPAEEAHDA